MNDYTAGVKDGTPLRVHRRAIWAHACEGDRCNKLSVDELKKTAVDMKAEDAKDAKDAKKASGSSISAMFPVIAFLVANMPVFF
ncbi:unnamed protein product, partial [Mesorhabditis spiculigera]